MAEWLSQHPEVIVSTIISATVSFVVVMLSHWATSKRERIEHLITKLEELYLLLNKGRELNSEKYNIIIKGKANPKLLLTKLQSLDDIYCYKLFRHMIMYVRLYFPRLELTQQHLYDNQKHLNDLISSFIDSGVLSIDEITQASFSIGEFLKKMEVEIIDNHAVLVGKKSFLKLYKRAHDAPLKKTHYL